jgi:hypothetical protein
MRNSIRYNNANVKPLGEIIATTLNKIVGPVSQSEISTAANIIEQTPSISGKTLGNMQSIVQLSEPLYSPNASSVSPERILFKLEYEGQTGIDAEEIIPFKTMVSPYEKGAISNWFDSYEFDPLSFTYYTVINDHERYLTSFHTLEEVISLSAADYNNWYDSWIDARCTEESLYEFPEKSTENQSNDI